MTNYKEINLLVEKHQVGDVDATALLLKQFNKLLLRVATKYHKKEPTLTMVDLYQHGVYVFLLLCKKYDPRKKVNFVGYIKQYFEHVYTDKMMEI